MIKNELKMIKKWLSLEKPYYFISSHIFIFPRTQTRWTIRCGSSYSLSFRLTIFLESHINFSRFFLSTACSHHKVIKIWFIEWNLFLHMCRAILWHFSSLLVYVVSLFSEKPQATRHRTQFFVFFLRRWEFNLIFIASSCCAWY